MKNLLLPYPGTKYNTFQCPSCTTVSSFKTFQHQLLYWKKTDFFFYHLSNTCLIFHCHSPLKSPQPLIAPLVYKRHLWTCKLIIKMCNEIKRLSYISPVLIYSIYHMDFFLKWLHNMCFHSLEIQQYVFQRNNSTMWFSMLLFKTTGVCCICLWALV